MSHSSHLISLAGAGIVALSYVALAACGSGGTEMKIVVMGGTGGIGSKLVAAITQVSHA